MTTLELKTKIQHALDDASERELTDILAYIDKTHKDAQRDAKRDLNAKKIIAEDDNLFARLAK